jgi:glycosyltransferase involved in cell wall biosynthesis
MRILHITNDLEIGGVQEVILSLLKNIDRERFDPYVATVAGGGVWMERAEGLGIKTRHFPCIRRNRLFKWIDPIQIVRLSIWIKKERIDLVHTHLFLGGMIGRMAALLARIRTIIHTEHSTYYWKRCYHIWIDRMLARITKRIISVTEAVKEFTIRQEGIPREKFLTIYNGIETKGERATKRMGGYMVGNIARFVERKGQAHLLEAIPYVIKEVEDVRFMMVGDGPLRKQIMERARGLGIIDRVVFTGMVNGVDEVIQEMDILVHTPEWEGFGLVLVEAMSYGIPVIAYRVGGIGEIVDDGRTGILVSFGDIKGLSMAIIDLLRNKERRERMGKSSIHKVKEIFNISSMKDRIESLYEETLREC